MVVGLVVGFSIAVIMVVVVLVFEVTVTVRVALAVAVVSCFFPYKWRRREWGVNVLFLKGGGILERKWKT